MLAGIVSLGVGLLAFLVLNRGSGTSILGLDRLLFAQDVGDDPRLKLWGRAIEKWSDAPIWGIGAGQFERFSGDVFRVAKSTGFGYVTHNTFLYFLVAFGVIGLGLFLGMLGWVVARLYAAPGLTRNAKHALLSGVVVLCSQFMTLNLQNLRYVWIYLGMLLGLAAVAKLKPDEDGDGHGTGPMTRLYTHEEYGARRYFPELDGVRAVSVLLVFTTHLDVLFWEHLQGSTGVTFFFVLSGYLITTLSLREESSAGHFGLGSFYLRRVFRIYPLYLFVLGTYVVLVLGFGMADERRDSFVHSLPYYLAFLPEQALLGHQGVEPPFSGAWSLGIEEKFYFVWPLLGFVVLAGRFRGRIAALLVAAVAFPFGGLLFGDVGTLVEPYALLAMGCLIAVLLHKPETYETTPAARARRRRSACSSGCWSSRSSRSRASPSAAPAVRRVRRARDRVFVGLLTSRSKVAAVLSTRPMVFLGRVSYAFYLTHNFAINGAQGALPGRRAVRRGDHPGGRAGPGDRPRVGAARHRREADDQARPQDRAPQQGRGVRCRPRPNPAPRRRRRTAREPARPQGQRPARPWPRPWPRSPATRRRCGTGSTAQPARDGPLPPRRGDAATSAATPDRCTYELPDLARFAEHHIDPLRETLRCRGCESKMRDRALAAGLLGVIAERYDVHAATVDELADRPARRRTHPRDRRQQPAREAAARRRPVALLPRPRVRRGRPRGRRGQRRPRGDAVRRRELRRHHHDRGHGARPPRRRRAPRDRPLPRPAGHLRLHRPVRPGARRDLGPHRPRDRRAAGPARCTCTATRACATRASSPTASSAATSSTTCASGASRRRFAPVDDPAIGAFGADLWLAKPIAG